MISIIIPCYNEEENVFALYNEICDVMVKYNIENEIIFIDDGSTDNTYKELKGLKVKIIKFRKRFGQTAAIDAGIKESKGETIITMDADCQNDPNDIPKLLDKLREGYDCVSGWRKDRRDNLMKRVISKGANLLRKILFKDNIHDSGCSLKAYKKECFKDLNLYGEMHRFIPEILSIKGFKVGEVVVNHRERKFGKTKYNFSRAGKGFLDMIALKFWGQYSARPMHLFGGVGLLLFIVGFLSSLGLSIYKLFNYYTFSLNRPLFMLTILMLIIGVQFIIFGLMSDMIMKLYYKRETPYNIEKVENVE